MNKITTFILLATVSTGLYLTACDNDDPVKFNDVEVKNAELKAILLTQGYTFNEAGQLVLDDKAQNTKTLDLSGTKISDLSGLDVLPNLTEVDLSDNDYGPAFDFSSLPAQIIAVDLTGNEIYDFDKLIDVEIEENGDETVTNLHNVIKLYLPESAKNNIDVLMRFYRENKTEIEDGTIDMKMEDENGVLQKYTTLRSIPDEGLRDYLKSTFSDMFSGDQIDISKRFGNAQKTTGIAIGLYASLKSVSSFEGIQYIINHPYWEGQIINIQMGEKVEVPHLKIGKNIPLVALGNLNAVEGLDFSGAESLPFIYLIGIDGLESIDLSASPIWGQRAATVEGDPMGSTLVAVDCPSLKEIKLPEKDKLYAWKIDVECLPALESIDLSKIQMLYQLFVGDLSAQCKMTYPNLTARYTYTGNLVPTFFICSQSTYERPETTAFIDKYYDEGNDESEDPGIWPTYMGLTSSKNTAIDWTK